MDVITILAQAVETAGQGQQPPQPAEEAAEAIVPIDLIWEHIISLNLVEALAFMSFGAVCLFYGWRIFKILVTISFGLIGLLAGIQLNRLLIGGNAIWLGVIFMVALAFLSVPLMRWAVCVLGAMAGGVLTSGIWYASPLAEQYIWAGALIGVVAGGMISFIIFKYAVILFTSLAGSSLIVMAILAIMYQYLGAAEQAEQLVFTHKWSMPVMLVIPMAVGILLQNKFIKGTKNWNI